MIMKQRYIISTTSEYCEVFDTQEKETVYANLSFDECKTKLDELKAQQEQVVETHT